RLFYYCLYLIGRMAKCCRFISKTQPPQSSLKKYYKQTRPRCHLDVVVFTAQKNIRICANPKSDWTKNMIKYLDNIKGDKHTKKHIIAGEITSSDHV
uniref:Chemokine interleukin-8-like domain-containing protein n=1 Tax=Periophthalmus magnuspinnatus TaxID=409849 RepID=A0A3B3ZGU4_9GOBI